MNIYDVIIIGAGPAGLTAGLYTSRAKFRTFVIEKEAMGGELANRDLIENYPGYPDGIKGMELGTRMATQVMNLGSEIQLGEAKHIRIEGNHKVVTTSRGEYSAKAIIIAGGCHPKKLGVPGEREFADKGVFYCATCDGPRFAGKTVAVAGAGNSGITEALFLARLGCRIIVLELLPHVTADGILQERISAYAGAEIRCGVKIETVRGKEHVDAIDIVDTNTWERSILQVDGILVRIGLEANTDYLKGSVPLDEKGRVLVNGDMETSIPGVFAAGDIRHNSPMQIATAVGDGAMAALSLAKYLSII